MRIRDIESFFILLSKSIKTPLRVILTGGAAAILHGIERSTEDIDFEVAKINNWGEFNRAINAVSKELNIRPQYSENIEHWSMIALPKKKSWLYKRFGRVEVRVLEPSLWAVGKLTRFLGSDEKDLSDVLSRVKPDPRSVARLWGQALGQSPASSEQGQFLKHVEYFFDRYAKRIWGKEANAENLKALFLSSAQSASKRKRRKLPSKST